MLAILLLAACAPNATPGPATADSDAATPDGVNSPGVALTVESVSISAEALSDPDAFMETYLENRITAWFNAGATPENARLAMEQGLSPQFAQQVAAEYDQIFIDALLVEGWESNPRLASWVDRMKEIHWETLQLYFATSDPSITPEDIEPYARYSNLETIISFTTNPDGSINIQNSEHDSDNADKNSIGERPGAEPVAGETDTPTRTFVIDGNGKIKLSDLIAG